MKIENRTNAKLTPPHKRMNKKTNAFVPIKGKTYLFRVDSGLDVSECADRFYTIAEAKVLKLF